MIAIFGVRCRPGLERVDGGCCRTGAPLSIQVRTAAISSAASLPAGGIFIDSEYRSA